MRSAAGLLSLGDSISTNSRIVSTMRSRCRSKWRRRSSHIAEPVTPDSFVFLLGTIIS